MANQDMKAKLVIDAETSGGDEVSALADGLEGLAQESGDAAPKLQELAQAVRAIGTQSKLVEDFARLKRETDTVAAAMDAASAKVDALAREMAQVGDAARRASDAQKSAALELNAAKQYQTQLREAIAQTRVELQQSKEELKQAGQGQAIYAERVRDGAAQLKLLQAEERAAAGNVRLLAAAYKESEAASKNAANDQKRLAAEYGRAVGSAGQLSGALRQSNQALGDTRVALQAAGVDTKGLSDKQVALKAQLLQAQQQARSYTEAIHQMRSETAALSPALEKTFKQLGMRGVQQITAEIGQLQAAMRGLKGQKLLPEDAARVTAELQRRIQALRAEMGGAQDAAKGAASAVKALGDGVDGAGSKIGAAAHKAVAWTGAFIGLGQLKQVAAAVLETGSSFEQLERRLASILGGTDKAREAFAMLKDLAQQTPFDVQGLTEAYAKLSAFGLKPTREQMLAMADTAATLGGGTEMLEGVTLALGQAWTKGKLQGEEILQLAERGVPAWDLLAQATGKNVQELQKMSEAGQLGRDVILQLIEAMGKKNAGASADLMNSYAGAVQRAQDALQEFFNMIAQSGVLEYLTQQLQGLLVKFDQLKASGELERWAKSIASGFREIAETAQNFFTLLQMLEPVIRAVVAAMVASKVASWAEALRGGGKAAEEAAAANGKLATAASGATGAMGQFMRLASGMAYAALAAEILKIASALGELRREREKQAAIAAEVDQKEARITQRLREISEATGVTVESMQELNAAQAAGLLVFEKATGKWLSAAQAQEKLSGAVKETTAKMAAADASKLVAEFEKTATAADKTKEAIERLAAGLKFGDVQGVSAFVMALDELAAKGRLSAKEVGEAWQEALGKLNAGQIGVLRANLEEASRQGVISAQQWAQANEQVLAASFEKLGVNAAQALGKISTGAQEAINQVDLVAESAKAAGVGAKDAARAIEMAFAAAIPKADSLQAIDAMEQKLKAMGAAGQLSADGMGRLQSALDKQRATIEGQIPGIQSLGEALRQLGVKPQAELKELARTAKEAFDVVQASGTATPREINEAWKAMAEAAIAANDGIADATIQSQARQHGFVIETDKAGKSIVKSMKEAEDATKKVGDAAKDGADGMREMASAADDSRTALQKQAAAQNEAANEAANAWADAQRKADKYFEEMAKIARESGAWAKDVPKLAWAMSAALKELDAAQQSLERSNQGAAQGLADLKMRLVELTGSEEDASRMRQAREAAELRSKMALLQIDIERSRIRKDAAEAARLEAELVLLKEQLLVLGQIHAAENNARQEKAREAERQAKEAEKQRKEQEAQAAAAQRMEQDKAQTLQKQASSASQTIGDAAAQKPALGGLGLNVTINANGINDPVALARKLEPELKRLAALAR